MVDTGCEMPGAEHDAVVVHRISGNRRRIVDDPSDGDHVDEDSLSLRVSLQDFLQASRVQRGLGQVDKLRAVYLRDNR